MNTLVGLDLVSLAVYVVTGLLSPFLVDIVTKRFASTQLKSVTLLAINLLTGLVVSFGDAHAAGTVFDWKAGALAAAISFVSGAAAVFHFKNLNIIGADSVLATRRGIGREDPAKVAKNLGPVVDADPAPVQEAPARTVTDPEGDEDRHHSGLDGF
jgi:hypothetical protein